ncbi:MAG TPA: LemA family protein [Puia sp.]|nr:LemA family protein [Puia sp.]
MAFNRTNKIWITLAGILVVVIIYFGVTYNDLVGRDENVKLTWGNLQNAYQRRLDLIPNLVIVVKGSSDYERQTLQQLAEARGKAQQAIVSGSGFGADNVKRQEQAQAAMVLSINKVIAIVEKYPDLQSTKSYVNFQVQLVGTERRIKVARNDYNASVAAYNKEVRGFPSNIPAGLFGFQPKVGFETQSGAEMPPEVKF